MTIAQASGVAFHISFMTAGQSKISLLKHMSTTDHFSLVGLLRQCPISDHVMILLRILTFKFSD